MIVRKKGQIKRETKTMSVKKVKVVAHTTQKKERIQLHHHHHQVVVMIKKEQILREKGYLCTFFRLISQTSHKFFRGVCYMYTISKILFN